MDTPQQIDYEAVLADLEARRTQIDTAIEAVRLIIGQGGQGSPATSGAALEQRRPSESTPAEIRGDTFFRMGVADAAKKYLTMAKGPRSLAEITAALVQGGITHSSKNFIATVHTALARRDEDFVKVKRGQWGLAEWYPGMRRPRKAESEEE